MIEGQTDSIEELNCERNRSITNNFRVSGVLSVIRPLLHAQIGDLQKPIFTAFFNSQQ